MPAASSGNFWALRARDLAALGAPGDAALLYARLTRHAAFASDHRSSVGAVVRADCPSVRRSSWHDTFAEPLPIGKRAQAFVADTLDFSLPEIQAQHPSADGATKLVLRLHDGATVEAVHMPRAVKNPRVTLCISSQVGCAMGCTFCHTAQMGLVRNLKAHEIVGQVITLVRALGPRQLGRVSVVFMGMGEPLHNLGEVARAIEVLADPAGLDIAPSRITVSTSGLVPQIRELAALAVRPTLALSLNATTNEARARTMPITKRWGLDDLRAVLTEFPRRSHEKITIEYVLLRDENDSDADAERLAELVRGFRHHVNVIPFNAYDGASFSAPDEEVLARFLAILRARGCLATVRRSRGRDVGAACGQLVQAGKHQRAPNAGRAPAPTPRLTT